MEVHWNIWSLLVGIFLRMDLLYASYARKEEKEGEGDIDLEDEF